MENRWLSIHVFFDSHRRARRVATRNLMDLVQVDEHVVGAGVVRERRRVVVVGGHRIDAERRERLQFGAQVDAVRTVPPADSIERRNHGVQKKQTMIKAPWKWKKKLRTD